jgi:hypothetical protein
MSPSMPRRARLLRLIASLLGLSVLACLAFVLPLQPSNDRLWSPDQTRLARALIDGDTVVIDNVRNAHYRSTSDYDVHWEQRQFDLRTLESVWFVVEPFADWRGPAHTLLSFGFSDGRYVAISAEIRKEEGESFSPWLGLLRQYELIYIIGDEHDLIGLRANHRNDDVYLYRVRSTQAQARAMFVSMLERAYALARRPEFYNTISNTCTSNIVDHIELIAPGRIPFSYRTLLPAYADDLAFDLGLIDTDLPRESYRTAHRINDPARRHAGAADFSAQIRAQR